jgi:hypothetical protein
MPIDPLLVPTANDPTTRLMQRMAALEVRLAAQERRKDFSITPFSISNGSSTTFTWAGGKLWALLGGLASTGAGFGGGFTGITPTVNGNTLTTFLIVSIAAGAHVEALPLLGMEVPKAYLAIGSSNTLAAVANPQPGTITGLLIESSLPA